MIKILIISLLVTLTPEEDRALAEFETQQRLDKIPKPKPAPDTTRYETDKAKAFIVINNPEVDSLQNVIDSLKQKWYKTKLKNGKTIDAIKTFSLPDKTRYFDYLYKYSGLLMDTAGIITLIESLIKIHEIEMQCLNKIMDTQEGNTRIKINNTMQIKKTELNKLNSYLLFRLQKIVQPIDKH